MLQLCAAGSSQAPRQGISPSAPSQHTESATTQIVHKALGFVTDKARTPLAQGPMDTKPGFDSQTFLDKVPLDCLPSNSMTTIACFNLDLLCLAVVHAR
jgi:hypothetical protein